MRAFISYFFGHIVGLTETGPFLDKTVAIAQAKIDESFLKRLFLLWAATGLYV